ncbi:anti-sigma factor family protein [Cytobacillus oceanisediminis]|uniref:anti-sigma factor family protein n=1 Tax=Cytobacillus oceanisediminis TaxID=665099 RepID=UPI003736144F
MDHYSLEEWLKYVKNELGEKDREAYEDHLYTCDQCLEVYLEAMEEEEYALPAMPREDEFTNLVMAQIPDNKVKEPPMLNVAKEQKKSSSQKMWFECCFTIALACLLLIGGLVKMLEGTKSKEEKLEQD